MEYEKKPVVSVIIPTYKRTQHFERAITSLFSQTYKNVEIVVVDDNADYPKIRFEVENIVKQKKQTKYFPVVFIKNKKNLGGSGSRNVGIDKATGDYITFLDDDDFYAENKIEIQIEKLLESNKDVSISNMVVVKDGQIKRIIKQHESIEYLEKKELLKYHLMHHMTGTPTIMLKRSIAQQVGGFPQVPSGQEFYFIYKLIVEGFSFHYLNDELVYIDQYHNEGRISTSFEKLEGEKYLFLFKKKHDYLFTKREWNYVVVRHYLVLGNYYFRNNNLKKFFVYGLRAVLKGPYSSIAILKEVLQRRVENDTKN